MSTSYAFLELSTVVVYFSLLLLVGFLSYRRKQSSDDFILGNRSANFWLTALSAQASDMGSWLFLGYPALVFSQGLFAAWAAIGLIIGMFINWHYVAPRLRRLTEQFGSLTLSAYFESRFRDQSGMLRLLSGLMSILFFTIYIASGLVAMGILMESLLGLSYQIGSAIGLTFIVGYVLLGGYRTVAWIDLFQGFFLLGVIVFIPLYLLPQVGALPDLFHAVSAKQLSTSLFPDFTLPTLWQILMTAIGWGLGYFGQPHILTKFMGIRRTEEMWKAKYLGISWLFVTLGAATLTGLLGIALFPHGLADSQQVILSLVQETLLPLLSGLVLCAILAATTNVMAAQILIVASNLSEDFYRKHFRKNASSQELLWVSRLSVVAVALVGYLIASLPHGSIYHLVLYAWSGLGASFGPLVLLSLYSKRIHRWGAAAGIVVGGSASAIWPYFNQLYQWEIAPIIPGFALGLIALYAVSLLLPVKEAAEVTKN